MADLGNLFFSLGLKTDDIDAAWNKALEKYKKEAKIVLKLDTKEVTAAQQQTKMDIESSKRKVLVKKEEQQIEREINKTRQANLLLEEKIRTQAARTQSVRERSAGAINQANKALSTQNRLMQNLHTLAASYISIFAGARLVRELVRITGEFEMQKVALQAILGDLVGANKIFDQIKQLAVKSPFQFKDLISYTKQLSAFSIPMNELYDTTKMLADVSAGLGVGMDRLVLAYGQIRAASVLRGQEVRQLTEAGIPVIEELRKKFEELGETGITAADVFDKISARLVPFEMIKEMFTDMTSEGGKFFQMQEIQAETLKGKVSNLTDAYQIMMAEIGEKSEGVLKGAVDGIRALMDNYEAVGKAIMELVVAYGVYRGALAANNALLAIQTRYGIYDIATKKLQIAATLQNITVQKMLNAVMAINPYVAAAAAITALSFGLYKIITQTSDYEKGLKKLAEAKESARAEYIKEEFELSKLYDRLKSAAEGTKDYQDAKDAIQRKYGSYLNGLKNERGEVVELADAYQLLVDKIKESAFQRGYQAYIDEATTEYSKVLAEQMVKMDRAIQSAIKKNVMNTREGALLSGELNAVLKGEKQLHELSESAKTLYSNLAKVSNGSVQYAVAQTSIARTNINKLSEEAKRLFSTQTYVDGGEYPMKPTWMSGDKWLKDLGKYATQYNSALQAAIMPKDDESTETYLSRMRDDYAETAKSIAINSQFAGKNVDALKERLNVLSGAFKVLGISPTEDKGGSKATDTKKEIDSLKVAQDKLEEMERRMYLDLSDARVQSMDDGWEKELAQLKLNHEKRLSEIERQRKELLEAQFNAGGSGTTLTPDNASVIVGLTNEANTQYTSRTNKLYKDSLDKYKGFSQKRNDIEEFYLQESIKINQMYSALSQEDYEEAMRNMAKAREKDLRELDDDILNSAISSSTLLQRIFGDLNNMTRGQLKKNIADAKLLLKYISGDGTGVLPKGTKPEDVEKMVGDYKAIAKVQKVILEMEQEIRDYGDTPIFSKLLTFRDELIASQEIYKAALEETDAEVQQLGKDAASAMKLQAMGTAVAIAGELADSFGRLADRMMEVAEATGNMKLKETAEEMKAASSVVSDTAKGFQQGGWIGAIIAAVFSMVTKTIDAFQQAKLQDAIYKKDQLNWISEYQRMMLTLDDNDYESIFGTRVLQKSIDAYKNAAKALRLYNDELNKRTAPTLEKDYIAQGAAMFFGSAQGSLKQVTAESKLAFDAYKKGYTDIQRMAIKTKDQSGWANFWGAKDEFKTLFDLAPELWGNDIGGDFDVKAARAFLDTNTQITEEQRKQIENLIKQKELYDENVNIIKDDLQDTFGHLGDSLLDALQNAIETGADSFDMFEDAGAQAIENLGRKLLYEIFLAERFKNFQDELAATYKDPTLDTPEKIADAQLNLMDKFFGGLEDDWESMVDFERRWREKAAEKGFNIYGGDGKSTLGGSIQAAQMTENTANLISSYINAIRADGARRTMFVEKLVPVIGGINDTMANGLTHLAAINANTFRSANGIDRLVEKVDALTTPNSTTRLNATIKTS